MKKDDPCISVCEFHGRTGRCVGCGRTVPEIRAWRTMTPNRRTALARALSRRISQIAGTATETDAPRTDKRRGQSGRKAIPTTRRDIEEAP